jgi:hypothetical protein
MTAVFPAVQRQDLPPRLAQFPNCEEQLSMLSSSQDPRLTEAHQDV